MRFVLAVDDSASKDAGHKLILAEDGLEALDYAQENSVDLAITDINMTNLNGIGLIKELRALPHYKYVPMLVRTTESGHDKKKEGKAAGATGWIVKPFDPTQLIASIDKVIS